MRTKTVRILNIVAGILLIAAGIYCLCNEDVAVLSAGLMLGCDLKDPDFCLTLGILLRAELQQKRITQPKP